MILRDRLQTLKARWFAPDMALSDEHRAGAFSAILQNLHDRGYFSFVRQPADDEEHAFLVGPMRFEAKGGPPEWLCGFSVY